MSTTVTWKAQAVNVTLSRGNIYHTPIKTPLTSIRFVSFNQIRLITDLSSCNGNNPGLTSHTWAPMNDRHQISSCPLTSSLPWLQSDSISSSSSSSSSSVPFTWAVSVAASVSDKNKSSKSYNKPTVTVRQQSKEDNSWHFFSLHLNHLTSVSDLSGIKLSMAMSSSDDSEKETR